MTAVSVNAEQGFASRRPLVLLPLKEVERRLGRKKSWIYANKALKPVKQGRNNFWPEHEIEALIQKAIAQRDQPN
jgi:predicted DNA-binding transcriptional regulator AlpA